MVERSCVGRFLGLHDRRLCVTIGQVKTLSVNWRLRVYFSLATMSKGYHEFKGFDPRIPGDGVFRLSLTMLENVSRYAPEAKLKNLYCVKAIIEKPAVAFQGLRTIDERFGDSREYVAVPD